MASEPLLVAFFLVRRMVLKILLSNALNRRLCLPPPPSRALSEGREGLWLQFGAPHAGIGAVLGSLQRVGYSRGPELLIFQAFR